MSLASGTKLGPYEILSPLGVGGMGEVYRARDTRLGRDVAIKVLPTEFASDPERLRRFEQEARATAALDHPNILAVFDIGTHEGTPYIVEQLLEGESLRERLRGGPLPPAKAVAFGVEIAQGLAAAHERGIVHRDLKPENLFITNEGRIKILDFGLARLRQNEQPHPEMQSEALTADSPTREGKVLGTPGYMSPEQVRGRPVDARTDVFAFGCILFEMLSAKQAFTGDTHTDVAAAILKEDAPDLLKLAPKTPPALAQLVNRCLEKRPEDRFSSAHDLAFALEAVSGGAITPPPSALPAPPDSWLHRHRTLLAGIVTALLLSAVVAGLVWNPWRRTGPGSAAQPPALGGVPSLVALPCKVLGSPESAYMTDAVPSTLSTLLGEVQGIDARIPPSSFEVERAHGDLDKVAAAYGVQTFVLSTVTAEGDHLVFDIQVADAKTRKVRWGHQYQGTRDTYTTMAREAVEGICKALLPDASAGPALSLPANSECELAIQLGKHDLARYVRRGERTDFDQALSAFKRAWHSDPNSAEAAARIAGAYCFAIDAGHIPRDSGITEAEAWVTKALELDTTYSLAWASGALLEAEKPDADMKKQIEWSLRAAWLGPKDPEAQSDFAMLGPATGGSDLLAAVALREHVRLDPLSSNGHTMLGIQLASSGRLEEALRALDAQLFLDPDTQWALVNKAWVLSEMGRIREAEALLDRLETGGPPVNYIRDWVKDVRRLLALDASDDASGHSALKAIDATFADPERSWNSLQFDIGILLPAVNRRVGKDAALDLLILSTKRGATYPYDALMLRADFKELREDPRAKDVVRKTKAPFVLLIHILQDARARGELPKYLEKPVDDLLKELEAKGAWP